MSDRIRKIKKANFIAEVAWVAGLLGTFSTMIVSLGVEGASRGPWFVVSMIFAALTLGVCVYGFIVASKADKAGIKQLPVFKDYLWGTADRVQ